MRKYIELSIGLTLLGTAVIFVLIGLATQSIQVVFIGIFIFIFFVVSGIVYNIITSFSKIKVSHTITEGGFTSTVTTYFTAEEFSQKMHLIDTYNARIKYPKNYTGERLDLSIPDYLNDDPFSKYDNDTSDSHIMSDGNAFTVTKTTKKKAHPFMIFILIIFFTTFVLIGIVSTGVFGDTSIINYITVAMFVLLFGSVFIYNIYSIIKSIIRKKH